MKRLMSGSVVLAALAGLWSCNGDPTESIRDANPKILATPTTVFVTQGSTEFVTVELVDGQGEALAADFEVQNVGTGITVERDANYLQTTNGSRVPTSSRFIVGGVDATSTSFELASGGITLPITVSVIPAGAGIPLATVATPGTTAADPIVLTIPAPFQFFPDSGVAFDAGAAIVIDRAADGRSITLFAPPGTTSTGTATILVDYLPTVPVTTSTDVPLTISATVPAMAGTDAPATAPEITIPPPGGTGGLFDAGTFGAAACGGNSGLPCQLYKFTLTEDATFDATLRYSNTTDMGLYFVTADGTTETGQACDAEVDGVSVETCTVTLPAGTYLAAVVSFAQFYAPPNDTDPTWIGIELSAPAP